MNIYHTSGTQKILKTWDEINNLYRNSVQKVSEMFEVLVKNENSRATAKVFVSAPHIPTSNLLILKASLGTLFL